MLPIATFCMALVGHLSMAVPLESPSSDLAQYFDSRIVGGTDATPGSSPHMVALVVGQFFVCGGSIITKSVILTAAHCTVSLIDWHTGNILSSAHAVAGTNTWRQGGVIIPLKDYKNHPEYDQWNIKNDGGVLIVKNEIQFTENIKPIALHCGWIGSGVKCQVSGWGTQELFGLVAENLQELDVKTISEKECAKMIDEFAILWGWAPPLNYLLEICTFHSPGHGMCHGDSGSALVVKEDTKHGCKQSGKQVGIVSWGMPCAIGAPDIFVRNSKEMLEFIFSFTGDLCDKQQTC